MIPIVPATDRSSTTLLDLYPSYAATRALDDLRAAEYPTLDGQGHTYLDFTAANLYAASQLERHQALLRAELFGNPHSTNPTSSSATEHIARARRAVLRFFNASPDEWTVVFTANASHALKLIGESYPFGPGDRFLLTFDNHNSVNGIREFARAAGAVATYIPVVLPDMRVDERDLMRELADVRPGHHHLFSYPAQSNFSGVQHPLEWIALAQAKGWDVLLDAAAFTATNRLDLGRYSPDFVVQSFYKLFGYPTGVGCLLAQEIRAREAPPSVVFGRHDHRGVGAGRQALPGRRRIGVRGRDARLPGDPGRRDRAPAHRVHRHRRDPRARALPHGLAARRTAGARADQRRAARPAVRPSERRTAAAASSRSISTARTDAPSTTASSSSTPTRRRSRCAPGVSAIRAAGKSRSA